MPCCSNKRFTTISYGSISTKIPTESAIKWFNKDNNGYWVLFSSNGIKKLVQFDNTGNFVKEKIDNQQEGDDQDEDDDNECECESD